MANPFVHIELSTDDVASAKKFYKSLFGWKLKDNDMGGGMIYTMIDVGGGTGGGMMKKPMPDAPTMWLPYVQVDSVKKTMAKAEKNGAKIIVDYHEVMSMGAFGIFTDPTGAVIAVWQPFMQPKKAAAKKKPAKKAAAKAKRKPAKR